MPSAFSMPPMRCSRPGGAGDRPRPGQRLGVAQVGPEDLGAVLVGVVRLGRELHRQVGQVVDVRDPPRLGAVGQVAVGEQEDRRAVRQRDPGGLDRGVEAVRRRCAARRSAPAPRRCGRTSPAAGRPARSWSAGRSRARRAGRRRRPAAAPATPPGRSSRTSARRPGPDVVVTPSAPPNAAPSAAPTPAISSSAWKVRTPKRLCLAQLVQDVRGRGDRVGAEEQRQPAQLRRGDQPVGQREVAGDVAVGARRACGAGLTS